MSTQKSNIERERVNLRSEPYFYWGNSSVNFKGQNHGGKSFPTFPVVDTPRFRIVIGITSIKSSTIIFIDLLSAAEDPDLRILMTKCRMDAYMHLRNDSVVPDSFFVVSGKNGGVTRHHILLRSLAICSAHFMKF